MSFDKALSYLAKKQQALADEKAEANQPWRKKALNNTVQPQDVLKKSSQIEPIIKREE